MNLTTSIVPARTAANSNLGLAASSTTSSMTIKGVDVRIREDDDEKAKGLVEQIVALDTNNKGLEDQIQAIRSENQKNEKINVLACKQI